MSDYQKLWIWGILTNFCCEISMILFTFSNSLNCLKLWYGQHHAKRDLRTYAKSVDPDQPPRLRRRIWSGSALFDTRHINSTYFSCCANKLITYRCFQHYTGTDLGLHYVKCAKVPFRMTLAIWFLYRGLAGWTGSFWFTSPHRIYEKKNKAIC